MNERIVTVWDDKEYYLQDAPAQEERSWFTPGKVANSLGGGSLPASAVKFRGQQDQNWPVEFPVKTGIPAVDNAGLMRGLQHNRVVLNRRLSVCDQVLGTSFPASAADTDDYDDLAGKEKTTGSEKIWQ